MIENDWTVFIDVYYSYFHCVYFNVVGDVDWVSTFICRRLVLLVLS